MSFIEEKIPLHFNTKFANCKVYFKALDTQESWVKNSNDPLYQDLFTRNGWTSDESIIYEHNSHGFRDSEFDNQKSALALGCSFTEGIGLCADQVWPKMLEQQLGMKVWNLGVGSSSANTVFRLVEYYIKRLNVHTVFVLEPFDERTELFVDGQPVACLPQMAVINNFYKQWMLDDQNSYYESIKNRLAIKQLCYEKNIKLISYSVRELTDGNAWNDRARDLQHYGPVTQQYIADNYIKRYYGN